MTNKEAIVILNDFLTNTEYLFTHKYSSEQLDAVARIAIGAIKRDTKVDDITFHWNDNKGSILAACSAFEDILEVYGRGVGNETN